MSTIAAPSNRERRPWWSVSAREARMHASILAVVLWLTAAVVGFAGPGDRSIAGPIKWADFVHFYTLGHLAATGHANDLYNYDAVHAAQARLVPEAADEVYPTPYPPQAALFFTLFAHWPYRLSALVWVVLTVILYVLIVRSAWREVRGDLPDWRLVAAAAAAFPPLWFVVIYGQGTIFILIAFFLGTRALARGRPYLAGFALGLLTIKPQFGLVVAAIVLCRREWRLMAGALTSVLVQALLVAFALDGSVILDFVRSVPVTVKNLDLLESKPFMSHSLRTLTRLLPTGVGVPLWWASSAIVVWYAVRAWRPEVPVRVRMAIVILASVLVNPHLIVYDAAILVLPLLWLGAAAPGNARAAVYGTAVYALFVLLLAPTAALVGIQASVFVIAWIFSFGVIRASAFPGARAATT